MNYDNIFLKGKSHKVCQDYSYADENCLIISDGCSSSENTDIGARILAQCAKINIGLIKFFNSYKTFGYAVISQAKMIANALKLNEECLDATLIVAVIKKSQDNDYSCFVVFLYGDGIVINDTEEQTFIHEIKFPNNAPFYLSYWINTERRKQYFAQFKYKVFINGEESEIDDLYYYNSIVKNKKNKLIISSDGLNSFLNINQGNKIELDEIINQSLSFKNLTGEYLKRRIIRMTQDYAKQNTHHLDDIALASYYIEK